SDLGNCTFYNGSYRFADVDEASAPRDRRRKVAPMLLKPDPTFYASAKDAMKAPPETLAYVALLSANGKGTDGIAVIDTDPASETYASPIGRVDLPNTGDELHHFGWNACSSALCPNAPKPHVERRHLVVPGLRSSRIYIIDTKPNGSQPRLVRTIEPKEII